ncbi:MAG: galactose-1-phosphate uridylyltransferase [Chloroflexota bacterium]
MPEIRQNLATKEWVIIATERAKRPHTYAETERQSITHHREAHDTNCPFCVGNEELDLETGRWPNEDPWQTRSVHNRYPALDKDENLSRSFKGSERFISGVGHHEVVVEHPKHNTTLGLMTASEVTAVLDMFYTRGWDIRNDQRVKQIVYFKNHGRQAGASLLHPHSQIIGLPVVPNNIRQRIQEARRYFDDTGTCVFCTMIASEMQNPERIISVNDHFVASIPYAASTPFNIWIVPHKHTVSFLYTTPEERIGLASVLQDVLHRLYIALNDPDYNLIIRSAPVSELGNDYLHWHLEIIPRLSQAAGFELGSGMHINPSFPEECASFLRDLRVNGT